MNTNGQYDSKLSFGEPPLNIDTGFIPTEHAADIIAPNDMIILENNADLNFSNPHNVMLPKRSYEEVKELERQII